MHIASGNNRTVTYNNGGPHRVIVAMTQTQTKLLVWIVLATLAAMLTYATFRGYLSPELLLGFANTFSC